jgi:hypothetical protein
MTTGRSVTWRTCASSVKMREPQRASHDNLLANSALPNMDVNACTWVRRTWRHHAYFAQRTTFKKHNPNLKRTCVLCTVSVNLRTRKPNRICHQSFRQTQLFKLSPILPDKLVCSPCHEYCWWRRSSARSFSFHVRNVNANWLHPFFLRLQTPYLRNTSVLKTYWALNRFLLRKTQHFPWFV